MNTEEPKDQPQPESPTTPAPASPTLESQQLTGLVSAANAAAQLAEAARTEAVRAETEAKAAATQAAAAAQRGDAAVATVQAAAALIGAAAAEKAKAEALAAEVSAKSAAAQAASLVMSPPLISHRKELLLAMYDQMFKDIDTHILVVWQSVGVLVGAFAIFALAEKNIISLDVASSLIVLLGGWLLAHLYDASYWYNRNLVIIANIERQFLSQEDLKQIHYYFGEHRSNKMIKHLRIQYALGIGVMAIIMGFHFSARVWPNVNAPGAKFEFLRALPYLVLIGTGIFLLWLKGNRDDSYTEFKRNSPGISVATTGIKYGVGHETS